MSRGSSEYEQLSPEQAARVDAACDGLERAWKAAQAGGTPPLIATYLESYPEPERSVLVQELVALDRACRHRYGVPIRPEDYQGLGDAAAEPVPADTPTHLTNNPL